MIIYEITNLINGKKYIGKDKNNNPNYLGSGKLITAAITKYGKQNFRKEILEYCDSYEHMCEREMFWIDKFDAIQSEKYYNLGTGGHGGDNWHNRKDTPEYHEFVKKMMAINNKPRNNTKHSDITKRNQSLAATDRYTLKWFQEKYGDELGHEKYLNRNKMLSNRFLTNNSKTWLDSLTPDILQQLLLQNSQEQIKRQFNVTHKRLYKKYLEFWGCKTYSEVMKILRN
jgi:group I intron endonuclease